MTTDTLRVWRDLLSRVEDSRLVLHATEGRHRQAVMDYFAEGGVAASRVEFVGQLPLRKYLDQYNRIDLALDPFPYGGGTTTCDALFMGVPVVTFAGRTAVSRGGSSILSNLGHRELIAPSGQEYLEIAMSLASDPNRLDVYRSKLRGEMEASPLMDAPGFARDVEAAFRWMWRGWCESRR